MFVEWHGNDIGMEYPADMDYDTACVVTEGAVRICPHARSVIIEDLHDGYLTVTAINGGVLGRDVTWRTTVREARRWHENGLKRSRTE